VPVDPAPPSGAAARRPDPILPDDPSAPPGSRLRRPGWDDLAAVADLYAAVALHTVGHVRTRPADLRVRWLGLDDFDDLLLVERDDARPPLVAHAAFDALADPWTDELDLQVELLVHPAWAGRGLGSFLLDRADRRARAAAAEHGASTVALRTAVLDGDEAARGFFARRGFVPVRYLLELQMDLHAAPPAAVWPAGVTLRTYEPGDDDAVLWRAHTAAFEDVPTHLPLTEDELLDSRLRRDPRADPSLVLLAEADGDVVGFAICRAGTEVAAEDGWVRDLGVVPAWRRRGIGMALLRATFAAFRARGLTGVALEVDDVSLEGAVALYRRAGMRVTRRTDVVERVVRL
jgi:mycothiol synthase